jgi:hypothetical protein
VRSQGEKTVPDREPPIIPRSDQRRLEQREDPVTAGVARATKAWKKYCSNRDYDRDAVYGYLQTVFELVQQWKKKGVADEYSLKALEQADLPIRMKRNPYARVIYCSSEEDDDPKQRSKWAKVMRFAAQHKEEGESFTEFVKRMGGLNECVALDSLGGPPIRKKHIR